MSATACNKILSIRLLTLFTILTLYVLAGCSSGMGVGNNLAAPQAVIGVQGLVHGGQQPVSGATITLWRVNTDGTAAASLMTGTAVTTASNGTFTLTVNGNYSITSCNSTSQAYIMATGGNAGGYSANSSLALMAALGNCQAVPNLTNISINEVSTVAAVFALQQFIGVSEGTPYAEDIAVNPASGLSAQSTTGMINAFATVPNLVSLGTGVANTTVGNATMESYKLNSIANIIATCVNSNGPTSTGCQSLFSAVTPSGSIMPGDTIQAALYMAQNPTNNVTNLYNLQTGTGSQVFLPDLNVAPFDFSLAITYTGSGLYLPNLLTSDASGNIWITNNGGSSSSALVELTANGTAATFLANTYIDGPQAVVPDTLGNIWVSAHGSNSSRGNRLVAYNPTARTVTNYSNLPSGCFPYSVAIDGHDNVFFACSALGNLYEFANTTSGTPASNNLPSYGSSSAPTLLGPIGSESYGMAIDGHDDVWVANTIASPNPTLTEYVAGNYSTAANTITLGSGPIGIGIDASNNVWAVNSGNLELEAYSSSSYTSSVYTGGGLSSGGYLAVDGRGYIWAVSRNVPAIAVSSTTTNYITISEYNNSGLAITPGLTTTEPGGLATPIAVPDSASGYGPSPRGITIDPSGNVWIAGCGLSTSCADVNGVAGNNSFVMEYVGVATPPVLPLANAQANSQLGCCSFTPVAPTNTTPTNSSGNVSLQASAAAFTQDNGQLSFEVTRSGGFNGAVAVNYSFVDGSARKGIDYSGSSGTLSWASGYSLPNTISVNWLPTSTYSGNKTFTVVLSCTSGSCPASVSPYSTETVTVTDTLTPPSTQPTLLPLSGTNYNFSLTLPIDAYGGTGGTNGSQFAAQTISNTTLASGFSDPYFYLNSSNQIVFTAPSNGATTSPGVGTNDTRSELREQYTGTNAIDTNDWDSLIGGTLNANVAVNQVSVDTTEATIGQIHGQNQPFALIEYLPTCTLSSVNYTGCVMLAELSTNTTNSASASYPLATGISLNTFFSYQLKLSGSTLSASVTNINGAGTISNGGASVTVDSSWLGNASADGMYFKLGAYSGAPNTGNPTGDQTQVTVSSFSISHP